MLAMIERFDILQVRQLPVEQVAEALGMTVGRHRSLCPFHDDTHPSLVFNTRRNSYRCYACDAHGGGIDLVMHLMHLPFVGAVEWLAQAFGITLANVKPRRFQGLVPRRVEVAAKPRQPAPQVDVQHLAHLVARPVLTALAQQFLYGERCLHPRVVQWLGISSIDHAVPMSSGAGSSRFCAPALLIPYRDMQGNLCSVQSRYLGCPDPRIPRFQFPKGSSCHVFNWPVANLLRQGEPLWIAEGVTDCMALLSSGRKAIAIPSATLLKDDDIRRLDSLVGGKGITLHIFPDQDAPGQRLYLQLKERLPCLNHHQLPDDCKDFGEYWCRINHNRHENPKNI